MDVTKKRTEAEEWAGHNKLLTPQDLKDQYRQLSWFEDLNSLGKRWQPRICDEDPVWQAQFRQACHLAYIGLWANGTGYFSHRDDMDAVVNKAWEYLKADIRSYDPAKSALGSRISQKISNRVKDALAFYTISRDHDAWADQLTLLEGQWRPDPDQRTRWIDNVMRETSRFYVKRINSVAAKPEVRSQIRAQLQDLLMDFDPEAGHLHALVQDWVINSLGGDQQDVSMVSVDTPVGEDGGTIKEFIPDKGSDPSGIVEEASELSIILAALIANFQLYAGNGGYKKKTLYARLNYTEQLSCFAQTLPLPDDHSQALLKPLEENYFRYFMQVAPTAGLTLRSIEQARIRSVIGAEPYLLRQAHWDKQGFLPAKAQMGYLAEQGISSSDATVSEHRKPYREAFLGDLMKRR